jgi:hypothetical protein
MPYSTSNPDETQRRLEVLRNSLAEDATYTRLQHELLDYSYPEIQGITERVRQEFAMAAVSYYSVLSSSFSMEQVWNCIGPVLVHFSKDCKFKPQVEVATRLAHNSAIDYTDYPNEPKIPYEKVLQTWPQLKFLAHLSIQTRHLFFPCLMVEAAEFSRSCANRQNCRKWRGLGKLFR